jgi:hypothetical protein
MDDVVGSVNNTKLSLEKYSDFTRLIVVNINDKKNIIENMNTSTLVGNVPLKSNTFMNFAK